LFNEVKLQYNVENINDSSHPIFLNFVSGNTFDLAINTKYVFNVPITLNNIQNFTLNAYFVLIAKSKVFPETKFKKIG
ncbi:MAG: hypothetical protein AAFU57_09435, partial [Bacteroidota bacterium]